MAVAYRNPHNDTILLSLDDTEADVIADSMESLLDGNPDDSTASEILEAIRG